jgi:hypothetical protein
MINKMPFKFAVNAILSLLSTVMIFHLLILSQIIPFDIVWGGNLQTTEQMIVFEIMSILINLFMMCTLCVKVKYFNINIPERIINLILWIFVVLFTLNTVGNVFSKSRLEAIIFTPITLISAILWYRIVIEGKRRKDEDNV